jgi:hypothetical protein
MGAESRDTLRLFNFGSARAPSMGMIHRQCIPRTIAFRPASEFQSSSLQACDSRVDHTWEAARKMLPNQPFPSVVGMRKVCHATL